MKRAETGAARRFRAMALALVAGFGATGAAGASELSTPPPCGDGASGVDRSRIVSIGGTVTEILYDLGFGDRIVAVDTTSLYPPEALKEKPNVGYMRALSSEGVLSTSPSLLVVSEGSGPPDVLDVLERSSVPLVYVDDEPSADAVVDRVRFLGAVMCVPEKAETLAADIEVGFDSLADLRSRIEAPKRVLFVMSLQNGRPLVAGAGTSADAIIALAGAENAAADLTGYKPMSEEAVMEAAPDAVLMMERGAHSAPDVLALPAFRLTPAGRNGRLIEMDGLFLLGFGPRTPEAAADLARAVYPDLGRGTQE
ncbi:heme/hemin ABC transporter substrate-binding protein [Amorphus orientalis]|nr:ABC transporter substrate-binding protein [Amorphus orientalis]